MNDPGLENHDPADWPTGEQIVLDHVRGAVLDIGSGAGRYAIELRDRGHEVLALDNSPGAIEACTRRGLTNVFTGDIHELPGQTTFDTFLLGGNNIGLLEDPRQALRFLDRLSGLARPGPESSAPTNPRPQPATPISWPTTNSTVPVAVSQDSSGCGYDTTASPPLGSSTGSPTPRTWRRWPQTRVASHR